jgi:hypothetical protein
MHAIARKRRSSQAIRIDLSVMELLLSDENNALWEKARARPDPDSSGDLCGARAKFTYAAGCRTKVQSILNPVRRLLISPIA